MILTKTGDMEMGREENEACFDLDREELLLDICNASARWEKTGDEAPGGSSFSLTIGEETIRGRLTIGKYGMDVEMTSPAQMSKNVRFLLGVRNGSGTLAKNGMKNGSATDRCRREAVRILMGMYNDWKEILNRKDTILAKFREMPEKEREYMERETARSAVLREKEKMLANLSGELKRCFKAGLFSQKEYVPLRRSLHDKIVSLKSEARIPDFFQVYFIEEIEACMTVGTPEHLIRRVIEEYGPH